MSGEQRVLATILAGLALLTGADLAWAQSMGSSGGSSGGSFGGSSGGSSSSSSSFGSSGSSSSSFLGTTTGASSFLGTTTPTTNTSTSGVGSTSFLGQNYSSAVAQGLGSATSTTGTTTNTAFGTAMYNLTQTNTATYSPGGKSGSSGSLGSRGSSSNNFGSRSSSSSNYGSSSSNNNVTAPVFGTSYGTPRAPTYTAGLAFARPATVAPGEMRSNLQAVLVNSNRLAQPDKVNVIMDNGVTVLRGTVATERERSVAEAMIRLNPGVGDVRNELVLSP
jgi:hypothetical protein